MRSASEDARLKELNGKLLRSIVLNSNELDEWKALRAKPPGRRSLKRTADPKPFDELADACTGVVAREIANLQRERDVYTAKMGEAIAKLEAAVARADAVALNGSRQ